MSSFKIEVDTVQQRCLQDGVSTLVGKQDWDLAWLWANNCYMDGSTGTVMLVPGAFDGTGNWTGLNTGIYAKLPQTDFTFTPFGSANYSNPTLNRDGSQWAKFVDNTSGFGGITTYSVAVNQALAINLYVGNTTANTDVAGDFGWGSSGDATTGVSLRLYQNGSFDIWKAVTNVASNVTLAGQNADYGQTDGQIPSQTQNQYITILVIPCRQRELLILSSNGGGYSFIFEDIPEGNPGGLPITPSAPVWFYAAPGVDTVWQMALCQYASSGNAIGKQSFWRYDPGASPTGGFQHNLWQDLQGGTSSLLVADGVNPANPYANNTNGVRINVTLNGSSISSGPYSPTTTPFLYAAQAYTLTQLAKTWGASPLDVTSYCLDLEMEWSDSVNSTKGHLVLKDPLAIIAAGVALDSTNKPGWLIQAIAERSWQIYDDNGTQILEGMNGPPKYLKGTYIDPMTGDAVWGTSTNPKERLEFEMFDLWKLLENYVFKDQYPLDNFTLIQAMTLITDMAGVTDSHSMGGFSNTWTMSTSLATFVLPNAGNVTDSDFNFMIESGDRASDKLDELFKKYAGNAFLTLVPSGGYVTPQLLVEADLPSSPAATYYDSQATAIAQGVSSPTYLNYFRTTDVQMIMSEANDLYVQGKDYRFQRPILTHKLDTTNSPSDPTIIPANRKPNWRGQRISYAWNDPDLSTQGACDYAMSLLFPRLTIARSLTEIEIDFNPALTRGTQIKLYYAANGGIIDSVTGALDNPVTGRIKTISARFVYTANDSLGAKWRPTKYVVQNGTSDASMLNSAHASLEHIWMEYALKLMSQVHQKGDDNDKDVWRRPYNSQHEA